MTKVNLILSLVEIARTAKQTHTKNKIAKLPVTIVHLDITHNQKKVNPRAVIRVELNQKIVVTMNIGF